MALPIQPNTTCDIYRLGGMPPAAPAVAGVPCYLQPAWRDGQEAGDRVSLPTSLAWTHVALVDVGVDIRDGYSGSLSVLGQDTIYVPDQNGTPLRVTFVERVHRHEPFDHKRVYLDRLAPPWPTNEV